MNIEIEDHEIRKYENTKITKAVESSKEIPWIHEFENKDVCNSVSRVKFTAESYLKYWFYVNFWKFKVNYSYYSNFNLKTDSFV